MGYISTLKDAEFYWYFAEPDGDKPWLKPNARADFASLVDLARTVEELGFKGILIPAGRGRSDPWVVACLFAGTTSTLKVIVAQYPAGSSPQALVDRVVTFERLFPRRLVLNLVMGERASLERHGVSLGHSERYQFAAQYWSDCCRIAQAEGQGFTSDRPLIMTGGGSNESVEFAATFADSWLSLAVPPAEVSPQIAYLKEMADKRSRTVDCGIRLNLILRETNEAAWQEAEAMFALVHPTLNLTDSRQPTTDRVGAAALQKSIASRMLSAKCARDLELHPGLWGGFGMTRAGPVTAAVGGPDEVIALLDEYVAVGARRFILGGYPHLNEARRFASLIFQRLRG
jgi:alkanesulfonate monooxygenase